MSSASTRGSSAATQVLADFNAGANTVVLPPPVSAPPKLSVSTSSGNLVITWPTSASGYTLWSTPSLSAPAWSTVGTGTVVGSVYQVTIPMTGQAAYFRLKQ